MKVCLICTKNCLKKEIHKKNKELAQEMKDKAADLKNKTKKMPKNENEKANEILYIVSKIIQ